MTFDEKKLYELLPAIYQIRDIEAAQSTDPPALRALLKLIAGQAQVIEQNLAQLYDDQFVETCAPWVLPYIGDLIGIKGLPGGNLEALNPRSEVGHTIGARRRKGTAPMLEQLARDVTGWKARAVEFFQLLATTQYMNHLRPENISTINVRDAEQLEYLGTAFEHSATLKKDLTHIVDVRRIGSKRGRYNIPNVGIFLWRLTAFPVTDSPAVPVPGSHTQFFFSPLGCNHPLFNSPETEDEITHLAEPVNVSDRIRRRVLKKNFSRYYGKNKSIFLKRDASPAHVPVTKDEIEVCNLNSWRNPASGKIAIDPALGRIEFPADQPQTGPPLVTFHYGFSAPMGGGEYNRLGSFETRPTAPDAPHPIVKRLVANTPIDNPSKATIETTIAEPSGQIKDGVIIEILNSGRYQGETLSIDATGPDSSTRGIVVLRAADKKRPVIVLSKELEITGGEKDEVILDGLIIIGAGIKITGKLGSFQLRHCTLVPGLSLDTGGQPTHPDEKSLRVESQSTRVVIAHSIVGAIRADVDADVTINASIVDATGPEKMAYGAVGEFDAPLRITNSTVIGCVSASVMRLASNVIFLAEGPDKKELKKTKLTAPVTAERRQEGCVRFSYLSHRANLPFRYYCQPEPESSLVKPRFNSIHFSDPEYCQLSAYCPCEIRRGADDEASMGAFHDLFEPQREDHLRTRLIEYLRFGLEAGIFYVPDDIHKGVLPR